MRKPYSCLILCLILSVAGTAGAEVSVFYQPDSGYLRVEGQLTIQPTVAPLSLLIFPNAQITEFWVEGLEDYRLERGPQGTLVSFSMGENVHSTLLDLSYEGFLPLKGDHIILNRDTLWFPEFSFPISPPTFTAELPLEWEISVGNELHREVKNFSSLIKWQPLAQSYPQFTVDRSGPLQKEETATLETPQPIMKPQPEPQGEQQPPTAEFLSRIQIQVARLVNLINTRDVQGIESLVNTALQKQGLPKYLASVPKTYGGTTSEFLTEPTFAEEPFQVVFITQKGSRFLATMSWQETDGTMILQTFSLIPAGQQIPLVIKQSLTAFIQSLHTAVQMGNKTKLESSINSERPVELISEFLSTLNTDVTWEVKYVALEPLSITVLIPHSPRTKLLLNVGLVPGEEDWLIDTLDVVPLR